MESSRPLSFTVESQDSRDHIDLNLCTYEEDENFASQVESNFITYFSTWKLEKALKDVQPRGYGRVVNFKSDFEPGDRLSPPWAKFNKPP
mmetsp:Transcript_44796/g.66463  ORF Transcript_44796/g.66463 Transcript_44796/m.66463 type:complete len:90 (+) Transcript_44796:158-427(+)